MSTTTTGTSIDEVADGIFRIHTPTELGGGGGFSFNQYLILDDEPLLFHTGLRRHFGVVSEALEVACNCSGRTLRFYAQTTVKRVWTSSSRRSRTWCCWMSTCRA